MVLTDSSTVVVTDGIDSSTPFGAVGSAELTTVLDYYHHVLCETPPLLEVLCSRAIDILVSNLRNAGGAHRSFGRQICRQVKCFCAVLRRAFPCVFFSSGVAFKTSAILPHGGI